jgi:wyosine [tRNA(Phe)-imidazoG37] synthetase (radical SAM superfamily)
MNTETEKQLAEIEKKAIEITYPMAFKKGMEMKNTQFKQLVDEAEKEIDKRIVLTALRKNEGRRAYFLELTKKEFIEIIRQVFAELRENIK